MVLVITLIGITSDESGLGPSKFDRGPDQSVCASIRMMSDFEVSMSDSKEIYVKFRGPKGGPYEGGIWKVRVVLPLAYPYKSPSIGFCNKVFHPNVDEASGSVCLDVINQTWSPMFDLLNIFSVFLPQLLGYPNPSDPLNGEAAALLLASPKAYNDRVVEYVKKYASVDFKVQDEEDEEDEELLEDDEENRDQSKSKEKKTEEVADQFADNEWPIEDDLVMDEDLSELDDDHDDHRFEGRIPPPLSAGAALKV